MTPSQITGELRKAMEVLGGIVQRLETLEDAQPDATPGLFPDMPEPEQVKPLLIPYAQIVQNYNNVCNTLPRCTLLSESRRNHIKCRFIESGSPKDCFISFFERVNNSDFLTGRSGAEFRASFDWLMKPANFVKVAEGNYDNKGFSKHKALTDEDHRKGF